MHQKTVLYCFTKYQDNGPSSRYRTFQYLERLEKEYQVIVHAGFGHWYLNGNSKGLTKVWLLLKGFLKRWYQILTLPSNCVVWMEYEMFPYMPPIAEWYLTFRKIPYCVDYDDAIFHNYDQKGPWLFRLLLRNKIPWVMKHAHTVVTGSPYLTRFARQHNPKTVEIPTSVDVVKYISNDEMLEGRNNNCFVVGWLGSGSTSPNIDLIADAFKIFASESRAELWLMGFDTTLTKILEGIDVKMLPWQAGQEIAFLNTIDVGIMPLIDTPFNHGKCGFKLVQYMAAGKPFISTPMEANIKINRNGRNLHAESTSQWLEAFRYCNQHPKEISETGRQNRELVEQFYSKKVNEENLLEVINTMRPK